MIELALLSLGGVATRAASDTARFVAEQAEQGRRRLQESYSLGLAAQGVFDDLSEVAAECSSPGWDGYGAAPITLETFCQAYQFLQALPLGTPAPSVSAEPDGHLTLEWYRSPRRTLSLSLSPEGDIHYAALLGASKAYGTEPFIGDVPSGIVELIQRVAMS